MLRLAPLVLAAAAPAFAQELLVTRFAPPRVALHDANTGALINGTFIDVDGLVGLGGVTQILWEAIVADNGEIWVTNYTQQRIHRFSGDGTAYLGDFPTSPGFGLGLEQFAGSAWVCAESGPFGTSIVEYDETTLAQTGVVPGALYPYDALVYQSQLLVSFTNGNIERLDPATGSYVGTFSSPGGFLEQMAPTASGDLIVGKFTPTEISVISPTGAVLANYPVTGASFINGLAELGTGEILLSGGGGTFRFDPSTGVATPVDTPGVGGYVTRRDAGSSTIGTVYCGPAIANSTGVPARISATGSRLVSDNDLTLVADALPTGSFSFFLTSRTQGFAPNAGGSQGNLCLGGAIGRYVGPGEIQQAGAAGRVSLSLDLTRTPTPLGFVPIASGEAWSFQAWYRDAVGGVATSNFTDGLRIDFN